MTTAIVLSHAGIAHELGHLATWLDDQGVTVKRRFREDGPFRPDADLLIVLGSPASVATGHSEPPAHAEIDLVADWIRADRPYLGICFGAQVLAMAAGGSVRRLPRTFRGYVTLDAAAGREQSVGGPWVVWHEDAITAPPGADVLGSLEHADLVFRVGRAWGLQPHVEVTPAILERMLAGLGATPVEYEGIVASLADDSSANAQRVAALLDDFAADALGT